ncbi:MAG TPA: long-chain fatty acid--CoA ligase, partial [Terriglobales bacterium]|nr:long-chain fatty acid--CoA ligase [Terriglobales bacterium]
TMMQYPLTLHHLLERAGKIFPQMEVLSRLPDRSLHRSTWGEVYHRARALAEALEKAGIRRGDRVATLMWNHYAHVEAYLGIPAAGAIVHTLNLRLAPGEIAYIANHAGSRVLIVDDILLPLYDKFKANTHFERVIVVPLCGEPVDASYTNYEDFLKTAAGDFDYPRLDENEGASLCYTSGTTGVPKGVLYSHRSVLLHMFLLTMADNFAISHADVVLPVVSMFHVNGWGLPYAASLVGCKLVLPGPYLDGESLLELCEQHRVTVSAGVPTVWFNVIEALEKYPGRWKVSPMRVLIGGSAPPESLIAKLDSYGMKVIQGWGLTESSPQATASQLRAHMHAWPKEKQYQVKARAGLPVPLVDVRLMNENGEVPHDGETMGEVQLRGPWVAASYYNLPEERDKWTADGWFRTGDVATIDREGYLKIADRTKDLIKSGGEWISSVDLENALVGHPDVREAAVIAVSHPKWQERPIAVVVLREAARVSAQQLREFLSPHFAKWQLPDAFVFVDQLPHTSTGKLLKKALREQYRDWKWES